ncbi:hypothetical protein [Methylocystis sp. S23]
MSEETPGRWFEAREASLAAGDRLLWLSLVLAVVGGGAWQVWRHDVWRSEAPVLAIAHPALVHPKGRPAIDFAPTASIRRRAE